MRVIAAPTAFKGSLPAVRAAEALAAGFRSGGVAASAVPVADGGDGTGEVLARALGGEWREAEVADPFGRPISAPFLLLPDGTALVESAAVLGLGRLDFGELDPLTASSRGLGELVVAALGHGPRSLLVGLGGTATVDGGAGLLQVVSALSVETDVLCDVRNPLLGKRGAARAFAPQKGASADAVDRLEARLAAMAVLRPYADLPGAGAAGGLGAAFAALGARLVPGAGRVLRLIGFPERIHGAHLVVTGEGAIDATTLAGKAPAVVADACRRARVRCVAVAGRVVEPLPGVECRALSGQHLATEQDLVAMGEKLARELLQ
ncbi:MAG: glycerate kinase [Actinobacteria bacterium]|nr:glycerate kinase [Actinomycetota bacterium]